MQQIFSAIALLPPYLVFLSVVLVILPAITAIIVRYCLYQHLGRLTKSSRKLLAGFQLELEPKIINKLEKRCQEINLDREQINTTAIIEGVYSQEQFNCLGLTLNCEKTDNFTRVLPNLLLAFGLLGTFLGITINLSNLSQTITQVDLADMRSLVAELNQPLQGMGIAFLTSLIAVAFSSLLTVINLSWNTSLVKTNLIHSLEDYLDNIYLPQLQPMPPLVEAMERFNQDFGRMLHQLGNTIEQAVVNAFSRIENSASTFEQAANILDQSRFPEKLSSATNNLAIAQNQFSQSSLVLQKSTQAFEHSLDGMQKVARKLLEVSTEISNINQKYSNLVELSQHRNNIEQVGLKEIQMELARLIEQMQTKLG
ncbi:hypothetical protein STA3757_19560 [Stanieria sp. NIES-3757]|nr:hypothetical protein STA3757_19560 [Stanieria sp. NIES-3757]